MSEERWRFRNLVLPPLSVRGRLRYAIVRNVVRDLAPESVLELGAGQGAMGVRLARLAKYTGLEPDSTSFAVARSRVLSRGGRMLLGTHREVVGSEFPLVCAFEVLEHLEDDAAILEAWTELVRPGGHLMLSVPAFQDRFGPQDSYVGHFRRYEPQELRDKLLTAGLVDVRVIGYGWPLGNFMERVTNWVIRSKRSGEPPAVEERTAQSGRLFQPRRQLVGLVLAGISAPSILLQRLRPMAGTGVIAIGRKPSRVL